MYAIASILSEFFMLETIAHQDAQYCWHPFTQAQQAPQPMVVTHSKGAYIFSGEKAYLDAISSWWVVTHGHNHPRIVERLKAQLDTLSHVMFSGLTHQPATELADQLIQLLPHYAKVFFTDNGSTAIEAALKMTCQYWHQHQGQKQRTHFLAFKGGYHGDTFGAMSIGKTSGFYKPFEPWLCKVDFMDYPDTYLHDERIDEREEIILANLQDYLTQHHQMLLAFVFEPLVQGASGMRMSRPVFLNQVLKMLKSYGVLCIADEVMTGFGRTGKMFAIDYLEEKPDIICLSKGITGGFMPLGATITTQAIYDAFLSDNIFDAFLHGHSYTANPLACQAALGNLAVFKEEDTLTKIQQLQQQHMHYLQQLPEYCTHKRVLGNISAFNGLHEGYGATSFRLQALEKGLLLRPLADCVYTLTPYSLQEEDMHRMYSDIQSLMHAFYKATPQTRHRNLLRKLKDLF